MILIVKKVLLNAYLWPMFIIVTMVSLIFLPFMLFIYVVLLGRKLDYSIRWLISLYGWILVRLVPFFAPVTIEYRAGKHSDPCILVPNHNSSIEPYLFGALLIDASFVTSWPFNIPVYSPLMKLAGYINADEGWANMRRKAIYLLKSSCSIIVWPEGHRSRDGRLGRFKNGAFALAVETGYPVVPVCILGAEKLLPPGKSFFSPNHVRMILMEPVSPDGKGDHHQQIAVLRDKVRHIINKTLQENPPNS